MAVAFAVSLARRGGMEGADGDWPAGRSLLDASFGYRRGGGTTPMQFVLLRNTKG